MSIIDNLFTLRDAIDLVREEKSAAGISKAIDDAIFDGRLPIDGAVEEKRLQGGGRHARKSRLKYRTSAKDGMFLSNMYQIIRDVAAAHDKAPKYGSSNRDDYLSKFWRTEPMLAGAVYSMSAKMGALSWSITGKSDDAKFYATLLSQAAYSFDGYDWGGFISATAEDFYTLDRGTWWETARSGSSLYGALTALGHIDGLACWPTGNVKTPVWYQSTETGQSIKFKPGQYIHFASMPSPREQYYGLGLCAVSRALRAAKLLTGLRNYDEEKLANLPPEGVAAVSGLTMAEFKNALLLWQAERKKNKSLTFPQVLWLVGSQPNAKVDLKMIGFSQLPESFERGECVTQYMNTLALDFGVDVREFWPVSSSSLGTASESEIQHMKAKGKGPGEFISVLERSLNAEFPETIHFQFDTQDIGEDKVAAEVAGMWISAYLPLTKAGAMMSSPGGKLASGSTTTPADRGDAAGQVGVGGGDQGMGIISDEDFLRLLSDKGVLPDYIVNDDRVAIMDSEVYVRKEYPTACYVWKDGVLKGKMLPPIQLPAPSDVPDAEILKGGPGSGHHGHAGLDDVWGGSTPGKGGKKVDKPKVKSKTGYEPDASMLENMGNEVSTVRETLRAADQVDLIHDDHTTIKGGDNGRGWFIRKDGKLVDITTDFGGGTNDHVGFIAAMENAELLGMDQKFIDKFSDLFDRLYIDNPDFGSDAYEALDLEYYNAYEELWKRLHDAGNIRVREFRSSRGVSISVDSAAGWGRNPIKLMQDLIYENKIPNNKNARYSFINDYGSDRGVRIDDVSWQQLMEAEDVRELQYKEYKESLKRNIRGKPIPETEVTRGAGVTESAIKSELELWRGIHALASHAPHSEDEEEEIADEVDIN